MFSWHNGEANKKTAQGLRRALSVVVVLSFLCARLFIAFEAHHECGGEECPICACIEECARIIRGFGDLLPVITFIAAALSVAFLGSLAVSKELVFSTPILSKVRIND